MRNQQGRLDLYRWVRYPFPNWILDLLPPVSMVAHGALAAPDVGGDAVKPPSLDQVHGAAHQRWIFQFHVCVEEKYIRRGRPLRACIAAHGRKPSGNHLNVQAASE